jgi:hypothetical protein
MVGFRPVAVFDDRAAPMKGSLSGVPYGGTPADALSREHKVDTVIFALSHTRREQLVRLVDQARLNFRHVMIIPNLAGITNSAVVARNLAGTVGVEIKYNLLDPWSQRLKRILDLGGPWSGDFSSFPSSRCWRCSCAWSRAGLFSTPTSG